MRNIFILYMPPGNVEAMVHYEDTIRRRVEPERIFDKVDTGLAHKLRATFGEKKIAVWGSRNSTRNRGSFDRMEDGDEVLIVKGDTVQLLGRIAGKTVNPALSRELWQNIHGGPGEGWDLVYFIANPKEIGVSFSEVKRLLDYAENFQLRGFTSVSKERLETFYSEYDDLYSILLAIRQGHTINRLCGDVGLTLHEASEELEYAAAQIATEPDIEEPDQAAAISDHLRMQWTLLRMGIQAGEKVWAPRGDQSRITSAFDFDSFEETFAAGLDAQVTYVENIDVVWKEQFRIDAAFEVENSTSIYSGLLRFADLMTVAPNTQYPLFIVAPSERRSRVRDQLSRPVFKRLGIDDSVRYLSYDGVREIDEFFGPESGSLSVGLFSERAERLNN